MSVKRPVLLAVATAATLGVAVVLTFVGGILYWHLRLTKAVNALRVDGNDFSAEQTLSTAGSRSIPYLVRELEPGNDKHFLVVMSHELTFLVNGLEETGHFEALPDRRIPRVLMEDSAEEVTKKCTIVKTWWQESSGDYPSAWQFWTGRKQR